MLMIHVPTLIIGYIYLMFIILSLASKVLVFFKRFPLIFCHAMFFYMLDHAIGFFAMKFITYNCMFYTTSCNLYIHLLKAHIKTCKIFH
jgi:hypothetical protein